MSCHGPQATANSQTHACSHFTTARWHGVLHTKRSDFGGQRSFAFATFRLVLFTTFFTAPMGRCKIQRGAFTLLDRAKKSRCRASNEHALTVTAAPVDSTRAAGEASLRGQSPGRGQSPSRLKTTATRTFKMPCCQCTQGQLPSRGASGVGAADCSRQLRSPAQKCQLPVQGEVVMCVHAAFCQMALLRP